VGEIRAKHDRLKAPALIHRDLDLVQRLLRDLLTPDFKCVRVDSEIDYERVLDFVNRCQPALVGKVKLYSRDTPLYEEFGIQAELDKALKPKVWLKSGGYIVINQTEALVAVDVNTGKFVGKTNRLEDTIVKTNVDAVNEIVRQVRLRDLGGIIVIDFIDMDERKNRAKVVQALEEALRSDRAPTKVIAFNDFGLVAVTRKRVKQSLERTLCVPCTYCTGSGWVKSVNTVCNEILAEARKMAKGIDGNVLTLRVNPEVAKALKSREGSLVSELESHDQERRHHQRRPHRPSGTLRDLLAVAIRG
jgi:ribonuclease G